MSSSNIDTQRRIATIRERRAQLTRMLESQKRILDYCDRNDLWENMPWFDTRPQKRSGDLLHVFIAGSKVRELLTSDIERINKHMKLLESELARARRVPNRTNRIRNARDDLRISEQRVRQDIDRIIRNAEKRGHLSGEETEAIQSALGGIIDKAIIVAKLDQNRAAVAKLVGLVAELYTVDGVETDAARKGMEVAGSVAKARAQQGLKNLNKGGKVTAESARALFDSLADASLIGVDVSALHGQALGVVDHELQAAEKRFRNSPTSDNFVAMQKIENISIEMGGDAVEHPPKGLRRVKTGDRHQNAQRHIQAVLRFLFILGRDPSTQSRTVAEHRRTSARLRAADSLLIGRRRGHASGPRFGFWPAIRSAAPAGTAPRIPSPRRRRNARAGSAR